MLQHYNGDLFTQLAKTSHFDVEKSSFVPTLFQFFTSESVRVTVIAQSGLKNL